MPLLVLLLVPRMLVALVLLRLALLRLVVQGLLALRRLRLGRLTVGRRGLGLRVLRYGGRGLYQRFIPFFLGLTLGGLVAPVCWGYIAYVFGWYR